MLFYTLILRPGMGLDNHERGQEPGGYSLIKAIWVCAAPKGRVFGPFWFENTLLILVCFPFLSVLPF